MDRQVKWIVVAGLILILAGLLFGLVFSYSVDHRTRLITNDAYQPVFELISEGAEDEDWQALQREINSASRIYARAIDVHTHSTNLGILVMLMGLLYPVFSGGRHFGGALTIGLVLAAWLYPAGLMLQMFQSTLFGEVVAAVGSGLAIGTFALLLVGIWRGLESRTAYDDGAGEDA
jgi:ABC-type thiamin/hydroxymethylpyrimidine transport system permease subunit